MLDNRKRILIVDDNPDDIHILKEPLQEYAILAATSGEKALQIAIDSQPDIILLDVMLPDIDGYEVCQRLKSNPDTSDIDVIFVSAHDSIQEKLKGYEVGGCDYLIKPAQPSELLHKITLAMTSSDQRAESEADANTAKNTAITAIKSIGELGLVQEFMRDSYIINHSSELASLIIMSITHYGLESCVKISSFNETHYTSSQETITPIERELLSCILDETTLLERGARLIVNYGDISLLVKNMPIDENHRGRLKDNLASLIEFANVRLQALINQQKMTEFVNAAKESISEIESSIEKQNTTTTRITDEMLEQLTTLFSEVGLSEFQETNVQKFMENTIERLLANTDWNKKADQKIRSLNDQLKMITS